MIPLGRLRVLSHMVETNKSFAADVGVLAVFGKAVRTAASCERQYYPMSMVASPK